MLKKVFWLLKKANSWIFFLILIGSISWSIPLVKSGILHDYGIGFWGPNGHDGVWHISLINSLADGSFGMPIFAGEKLTNYHIGFDLLVAFMVRITSISATTLYFQIVPPVLAILIGVLTYKFVFLWQKDKAKAYWSVFFVYFGGSLGWVTTLLRDGTLGGESMFWSQQAVSTLVNPPFTLSLIFILAGLIFLIKYKNHRNSHFMILVSLFFGSLIQIKAHAGVLAIGGLLTVLLWQSLSKRKNTTLLRRGVVLKVLSGTILLSLVLFLPLNSGSSSLLVWQPFWFLETMMGLTDRLGWIRFHSAMTTYKMGGIWWKAIPAYIIAFLIFWYGNLGTRLLSEFWIAKKIVHKKLGDIEIFILSIICAGVVIPLFFVMEGTPWNTIQFFYYSLFFLSILAGIAFVEISRKLKLQKTIKIRLIEIALILLTIPTTYATLKNDYLPARPPAKLSVAEIEALTFLESQPDGVVLTYPFDEYAAKEAIKNPPRPLYLYESTAYVSAFSGKPVHVEDEVNLNITGYDWKTRRKNVMKFLGTLDEKEARDFLVENSISYIYWVKPQRAKLGESQLGLARIFENEEVDIYSVIK